MRFSKIWMFNTAIAIVLGTVCCGMRERVVHARVSSQIRSKFGDNVTYSALHKKWFSPVVTIRDLKVHDHLDGRKQLLLDVPFLTFTYDEDLLAKGQVFLKELRIEVAQLNLNSEGAFSPAFKKSLSRSHFKNRKKTFKGIESLVISCGSANISTKEGSHLLDVNFDQETVREVYGMKDLQPIIAKISRQNNWRNLGLALKTLSEYKRSLGFGTS